MKLVSKIQETYPTLTKSEKKVADYVLSNFDSVIHSTMYDIKKIIKVGDATIIRFCQRVGFSGFSDLKIAIAKEMIERKNTNDNTPPLLDEINEALNQTNQLLDEKSLKNAVDLIYNAKRIFIFGVGHSSIAAQELQSQLMRIGVMSYYIMDSHFQLHASSSFEKNDIAIFFSLSGRTKEIIDTAHIVRKNNGKIIGITNYLLSPLANFSDVVVQTSTDEFMDGGSIPGKISQLYIIGLILAKYQKVFDKERIITVREKALRSVMPRQIDY